ncbi:MAG: SMC-Scp complex subunit ScpB [Candidatus Diapherotrites archaeon]|nr:SMC-Scp complex subunit ScpB [Candidatus Diapherotrites archaeon]
MGEKGIKKTIEAALFMSPSAMHVETLAKICSTTIADVRAAVNELMHEYQERDSALQIKDDETGIKMSIKEEFQKTITGLTASPEFNKGTMKTLAYISYRQPVKQTEVIKFRNNKGYDHIKVLEERGFIKREQVGRSYLIYTTKKFLDYFGTQKKSVEKMGD